METFDDEILIDCIEKSGYYEHQDVNLDDLPNDKRIAIILAGELLALRPELITSNSDEVYILEFIMENGASSHSLPTKNLGSLLRKEPYDDSSIWLYSVKKEKFLRKLYKGTGTKWEAV